MELDAIADDLRDLRRAVEQNECRASVQEISGALAVAEGRIRDVVAALIAEVEVTDVYTRLAPMDDLAPVLSSPTQEDPPHDDQG